MSKRNIGLAVKIQVHVVTFNHVDNIKMVTIPS